MTDIVDRLRGQCVGHPSAKIPWPHRLLHEAADEIERLRAAIDSAGALACQNATPELTRSRLAEAKDW